VAVDGAVSVIIPTLALRERASYLRRALDSVFAQDGVRVVPIVVVNGQHRDTALTRELHRVPGVRIVVLEQADLPVALRTGRERVDTPWFAELDDDDELLPDALAIRLGALRERPEYDAVVTDGFVRGSRGDAPHFTHEPAQIMSDPLRALTRANWLSPGAALFRTRTVGVPLFHGMPRYLEWTYLAIRLATSCRLLFLEQPTFVYHTDTPASVSGSREYALGLPAAIERVLELDVPADVRWCYESRLAQACHAAAGLQLREGNARAAWRWHLRSLRARRGWRYLPFTRELLGEARRTRERDT
jgi:glycosyltransferase involved in cell wall biosynthesis